jgi:hypothetical protein
LEDLAGWLFDQIPGFSVRFRNTFSHDDSQEVDLAIWNDRHKSGFPSFGDRVLVECKNWEARVGSAQLAWFAWKLSKGNATDGFLIAANGITGDPARVADAWHVLQWANSFERRIVLLTLDDIDRLRTTQQLVRLAQDRLLAASLGADPFALPFPPP